MWEVSNQFVETPRLQFPASRGQVGFEAFFGPSAPTSFRHVDRHLSWINSATFFAWKKLAADVPYLTSPKRISLLLTKVWIFARSASGVAHGVCFMVVGYKLKVEFFRVDEWTNVFEVTAFLEDLFRPVTMRWIGVQSTQVHHQDPHQENLTAAFQILHECQHFLSHQKRK